MIKSLYNGQNLDFLSVLLRVISISSSTPISPNSLNRFCTALSNDAGFHKAVVFKRGFDIIVNKDQHKPEFLDIQPQSHNRSDYIVVVWDNPTARHLNFPRTIAIFSAALRIPYVCSSRVRELCWQHTRATHGTSGQKSDTVLSFSSISELYILLRMASALFSFINSVYTQILRLFTCTSRPFTMQKPLLAPKTHVSENFRTATPCTEPLIVLNCMTRKVF